MSGGGRTERVVLLLNRYCYTIDKCLVMLSFVFLVDIVT